MRDLLQTPVGIEIEYMLCDQQSLNVLPKVDQLLEKIAGKPAADVPGKHITFSNELVNHVIESKVSKPELLTAPLDDYFQAAVTDLQKAANTMRATLVPTGMHPWMDPARETMLWPGEYSEWYEEYDRVFNCHTHGFANLQSIHINLPFGNDEEFGKLHAAIRLVLPLIPAIAASSPIRDGVLQPELDTRLETYRINQRIIPFITGQIIPEQIYTQAEYKEQILERLYKEITPYGKAEFLQTEQLNARGCIARFDRNTFEIRITDSQECVSADLAVVQAIVSAVNMLAQETFTSTKQQQEMPTETLAQLLNTTIVSAEHTPIVNLVFLSHFGIHKAMTAGDIWQTLLQKERPQDTTLATRMKNRLGKTPTHEDVKQLFTELSTCLQQNKLFIP